MNHEARPTVSGCPRLAVIMAAIAFIVLGEWSPTGAKEVPAGSEFRVNTYTSFEQSESAVASDASGRFVVVWRSSGQIAGQRYQSDGMALGTEFQASTYTSGSPRRPDVASDPFGSFVAVWDLEGQDGSDSGVFGQRYDSDGTRAGTEFGVNTYTTDFQDQAKVAAGGDGNFVVVWRSIRQNGESDASVFGQRYQSDGTKLGSEFRVNTYSAGWQEHPDVAARASGDFVVVWSGPDDSGAGIQGRRYQSNGTVLGSEFQVNTYTTFNQFYPAVAASASGDFVVVWENFDGDLSRAVSGQRYDSAGSRLGTEFRVNTYEVGTQDRPAVAKDRKGGFVVVWQSEYTTGPDQDGDGRGVFGRRYNEKGASITTELQVNVYTTSSQERPAVAMQPNGGFLVTWDSFGQDGSGRGVYARRYAPVCKPAPRGICRTAAKSILIVKDDAADDAKDKIIWKWLKGAATSQTEFGDPTASTDYALCIYTGTTGTELDEPTVTADATKWSVLGTKGYKYKDPTRSEEGIQSILLKGGDPAKVLVKGKGSNLSDLTLGNLPLPVTVQLVNDETTECWEAVYDSDDIIVNDVARFKAKAK